MLFDFEKYEKRTACITEDGRQYTYSELGQMCREFGQYVSEQSKYMRAQMSCLAMQLEKKIWRWAM